MRVPGAAPPPERLAEPISLGPHRLAARVAAGRRTTTYLTAPAPGRPPVAVRMLEHAQDLEALTVELGSPVSAGGRHGFVQDLVVGESLATVLDLFLGESRALPLPIALTVAMGIAARLQTRTAPHLDLVPAHVLLGYDGGVHIIDPAPAGGRGDAPGREGYRAPEHIEGAPLDATTDVFALGILLFEMTTGTRLFDTDAADLSQKILQAQVPRPRDIVGDGYPIELQLVLRKLMRPSRAGRFPTPRAAQDALRLVATTRADVGPGPLASWLGTELASRQAVWAGLVAGDARLEPSAPAEARPRAPSRAQTRPSSFLGAGAPTIEELRLDHSTIEAVRRQILADGAAPAGSAPEHAALRAELAQMKQRRTELPAIAGAQTETTQPGTRAPDASEDTHQDLDVPPDLTEPPGAPHPLAPPAAPNRPKGLAASPPPTMVPELPTEVTRRFPPLPQPLGLEPADSDAATSLDELEAAPVPMAEIDMIGDDLGPLSDPSGPVTGPVFHLAPGARPGSLADLSPEALLAPTTDRGPVPSDLEPPPPTPAPGPRPGAGPSAAELALEPAPPTPTPDRGPALSEDLVLDPIADPNDGSWAAELLSEATDQVGASASTAPAPTDEGPELGDTIQDDAPSDLLGADALAQLQRAVDVVPKGAFDVNPPATRPDTAPTPGGRLPPFVGSVGGASGEGPVAPPLEPARPEAKRSRPAPAGPVEPRGLGVSPPPAGQAAIATQVVRDRIVPSEPPTSVPGPAEDLVRAHRPLNPPEEERDLTPTPHLDLGPPAPAASSSEEELSSANLVIPISDDELEATERRRRFRGVGVLALAGVLAVLAGALAWRFGGLGDLWPGATHPVGTAPEAAAPTRAAPPPAPTPIPPPTEPAPGRADDEAAAAPTTATPTTAEPDRAESSRAPEAPAALDPEVPPTAGEAEPDEAEAPPRTRRAPARAERRRSRPAPAPPPVVEPEPEPTPAADPEDAWTLRVEALPETATVRIDGRVVDNNQPVALAAPDAVEVAVSHDGYQTVTRTVSRTGAVVSVYILLRKQP